MLNMINMSGQAIRNHICSLLSPFAARSLKSANIGGDVIAIGSW
ncbi:hypothetical protein EaACW_1745 [Erwinia amylovora ACW56400]|uniref:Uncharacterized protein n=2 Tax=Erwinia amylovora TaxID=552 RepID=A0A830ZYL5_ERWAM|nr:hypothetical protein EaACW_1745 [Erwinia amylovora ACW56400]CBA20690.1 hypothetical protein predicted by Glimmer/Critica [Erwinia amylovora CFBP1430]CCO78593.1 hypothetical protein BN432_1795 [Erwinia amylovora Ea356]CCO82388.1 hypothetical protein BN433_1818 [Erwinia amylovora Ea266]CCO86174.1 hypothetical protein BN434_1786 [Erwinia amylovora CFBP 2585]CCO89961.1 hypothetical protein BN435_1790 [Erwinia amylovora 01SFR-BO]CCO93720.1 hypothetical protein BN437_1790 [Erwinia amylovora NBRC